MPNCPVCGESHRKKPTQCLLDAVDLHRDVCSAAKKHDPACRLEAVVDFVANSNSRYWADWD